MTKKLTKNVSISQGVADTEEREIVNFTKPFKKKPCFVVISHNITSGIYEVRGKSAFNEKITYDTKLYTDALCFFYKELCWMINPSIMGKTTIQRSMPKAAYLNN